MPVEPTVQFLNIDLLLSGAFDREALLDALGDALFVLHDDAELDGKECLILEVTGESRDLAGTLQGLLRWAEGLPPRARRSWAAASRRVFDIGVHAGLTPNATHWSIPHDQIAALATLGVDVVLTVYGAKWTARRVAAPAKTKPRRANGRRASRGR